MGCKRNFNTESFKTWLSSLHEEQPGTKFCKKEDGQREIYCYGHNHLVGQIIVWENNIVEEIITNKKTEERIFYLHYEMEDCDLIKNMVKSFQRKMFCECQKEYEVSEDDTKRNILLCCSSALTTTMFADMLQNFSNTNHLPYHFAATSIYDSEALSKPYDVVLMAPQVQHHTREMTEKYHQRFLVMNAEDFAQYNCNNIVSRVQEVFL